MRALSLLDARERLWASLTPALARIESRSAVAGFLSVFLHVALLATVLQMNVRAGDPAALPVLFVENFALRAPTQTAEPTDAEDIPPIADEAESAPPRVTPELDPVTPASIAEQLAAFEPSEIVTADLASEVDHPALSFEAENASTTPTLTVPPLIDLSRTRSVDMPLAQRASLIHRVIEAAQAMTSLEQKEVTWQEGDGRVYRAVLKRDRTQDSTDLERIAAEITTTDQGSSMQTKLLFSKLAFSQFTQVIDRWDPNVQLHDDEIVGRFHSNTAIIVGRSANATPKFLGKVTTAARSLRYAAGARQHQSEMFRGGIETSTARIDFPHEAVPFELEPPDDDAHVQRFDDDAHITLRADGSYTWQSRRAHEPSEVRYDASRPVFLLANPRSTLFVQGVVKGRVLLYSPERIVIEGSVVYATDPRLAESNDYLGLVSDRNVEIARPYVTGRGDLHVHAAIFARNRFVVTSFEHTRRATLAIFGSLSAGTMSASEPRYATKLEFDGRFDRVRPPGFPSTNRFELISWDESWHERPTIDTIETRVTN